MKTSTKKTVVLSMWFCINNNNQENTSFAGVENFQPLRFSTFLNVSGYVRTVGLSVLFSALYICPSLAQTEFAAIRKYQLSFPHVVAAWKKYNDSLSREFGKHGILYPPDDIYLRAFKSQNELELWARNNDYTEYRLVKLFHICALSGILGPKKTKGDKQVPEGFYFIDDFNPQSEYYLSMLIDYPNFSDRQLANEQKETDGSDKSLGGDIYIHGGCVTIGCLPMTDEGIKQLYVICLNAKLNGQENIPIHIYPTRFTKSSVIYLKREYEGDFVKLQFWNELKEQYDYFEKNHKLLPVMYAADGRYVY